MLSKAAHRSVLLCSLSSIVLGGCANLPASGPTAHQILQSAQENRDRNVFIVRELTLQTAAELEAAYRAMPAPAKPLTRLAARKPADLVGPGDVLDVRVYEVGVSLFGVMPNADATSEKSTTAAHAENFSGIVVDREGKIRFPYVGEVTASGLTTDQIGREIARQLRAKSQSPQVLVRLADTVNNAVFLSGAVAKSGVYSLSPGGTRLLDVVARAGGLQGVPEDLVVELTRDGQSVQQPLATIVPGTADDIQLQPGDRVQLSKRPRSFTIFGAAGRVSQIAFQTNEMTLAEAVAQAAGPNDSTADSTAVFLFRNIPDPVSGEPRRVIYRLNLMDPLGYFVAQDFKMRDKDLIYVANSRSNQATKFIALVGQLFSPVLTARALTR